uniref:Variant surface glycoprotein 1009 n=1 Tax=Trypanosoma brucei TaxID=5691 RepID=M4SVB5_9TRYP|nr:variant surface glycoprotein 1009 [Trypanosoma brucei]APD73015.1 variant surface glycoprotein 1125.164 [Trypanosoma brucei]
MKLQVIITTSFLLLVPVKPNSKAGENAAAFLALCRIIRIAKQTPQTIQFTNEADSIMKTIAAVNFTLADDTFSAAVDTTKTWATLDASFKDAHAGWQKYYDLYVEAKKLATGNDKHKYAPWARHRNQSHIKQKVALMAEKAFEIANQHTARKQEAENTMATSTAQAMALYGAPTPTTNTYKIGTSSDDNRAKVCSQQGGAGSLKPGANLVLDTLCLCTEGPAGDASGGKACCSDCAPGDGSSAVEHNSEAEKYWTKLEEQCTKLIPTANLDTNGLEAAVDMLRLQLKHKDGTQTAHDNVLGSIHSAGSNGCTGNAASNGGKCLSYKAGLTDAGVDGIAWLKNLRAAVAAEDKRNVAAATANKLEAQLTLINLTVASLLHSSAQNIGLPAATEGEKITASTKVNQEAAEKDCNKKEKESECKATPKCAWNDKAAYPKKKCTLSEEAKQAAEKAAQETGKNGKPDCSKLTTQTECEAVNKDGKKHCGWRGGKDNEEEKDKVKCRSASFLVNYKLSLSMAAGF